MRQPHFSETIIPLLCCPITRTPLRLLKAEEAAALGFENRPVLLREQGDLAYLFDERGLPVLLPGTGQPVPAID